MTDLELRPISAIFGAEVLGVDLAEELSDTVKETLRQGWLEHSLLLFRSQHLTDAQADRASGIFGPVTLAGDYGNRRFVSNVVSDGLAPRGELLFHIDFSFSDDPLRGLSLYAVEVPPQGSGGNTRFASAALAYRHLPRSVSERLTDVTVVHSTHAVPAEERPPTEEHSAHPVIYPHPVTGEKLLFCSPRHFKEVVSYTTEESAAFCSEMSAYFESPEIQIEHVWREGDFLVWDNLKLQHARTYFDPRHRRHLRRTQIAAPAEAAAWV